MQFNVPQFIEIEDKILGPLTLKQFLLFLGAALVLIFLWYLFRLAVVIIVGVPLLLFLGAGVFIKINGRSFFIYILSWFKFWASPRVYVWRRKQ